MRVGLVVRGDVDNAAARVRMTNLVPAIEARGHQVRVVRWQARDRAGLAGAAAATLALARWADGIVVQRPRQPVVVLRAVRALCRSLVVDFDDALWVTAAGDDAGERRRRLEAALGLATGVTVASQVLADWARPRAGRAPVHVVRSPVDLGSMPLAAHPDRTTPVAVWIGSPGNFRDFTAPVVAVLRRLVEEGRLTLRIVSSAPFTAVPSELVAWSATGESAALATADIGLMPLEDTERSRGRGGYKAIQCLAAGLPVVASPVGAARELVTPDRGRLAADADQWERALRELAGSPDRRRQLGRAGRRWVEEHATVEVAAEALLGALGPRA